MVAPSNLIFTSTTLSLVGTSRPWTAAWALITDLPSAVGMSLSRVWVPLSAPFSNAKVGTTLCHGLAGSADSKSSENSNSFFTASDLAGSGAGSAAVAWAATTKRASVSARTVVFIEGSGRGGLAEAGS